MTEPAVQPESVPAGGVPVTRSHRLQHANRIEILFTLVMAIAAVATAWAGFESSQWSRRQSALTTQAATIRLQATHEFNRAEQLRTLDELMFTQWLNAVNIEMLAGPSATSDKTYVAHEKAISRFLLSRFPAEFKPAMRAWLATDPLNNPKAPATPFAMPQYMLASQAKAEKLSAVAETSTVQARQAGARASNYTLTGLLFALAVFFAAIGNKAVAGFNQRLLLGLSALTLLGTLVALLLSPVAL